MTDEPDQRNPWDPPAAGPGQPPPAPGYGQPQYGEPQYGQPQHGQPQYGQPQYEQQSGQPPYPPAPPPPPSYGQPPPYGYAAPAGTYGAQPYYGPKTSGKATTVMVLGILSLVLMFMCGLGFILAIVALVMVSGARREIAESAGQLTGEGQIKAGKIMSWISLGLTALGIVALVVVIVVAVSTSDDSGQAPTGGVRTNATSIAAPGT